MKGPIINRKRIPMEERSDVYGIHQPSPQSKTRASQDIRISAREKEVLMWVGQGKSSSDISQILGISSRTVNSYVYRIMEGLEAVNRPQMVAIALRKELLR